MPLENPFQAVQGKMVRALAHDDLRQKPRRRQGSGNRFGRLGSHHHVLLRQRQAAFGELLATDVFLADMNQDMQCRRPPIILFALLRRQFGQVLGAAQSFLFGVRQIVNDFLTLNLLGNAAASVPIAVCSARRRGLRRCRRHGLVLVSLGPRIEQQRLLGIELLARAAVQTPQQQMHVVLLPLESRLGLLQLVEQLHDQLLEHDGLVGQRGGIDRERGCRRPCPYRYRCSQNYSTAVPKNLLRSCQPAR